MPVTQQHSLSSSSAATRSNSGSCLRCSCAYRSTRECSCSRSSSRSLLSKTARLENEKTKTQRCLCRMCCDEICCIRSCKAQRNLNSAFAIIMGLNTAAVSRLNQTWEVSVCVRLPESVPNFKKDKTPHQISLSLSPNPPRNVQGSSRNFSRSWSSLRWDSTDVQIHAHVLKEMLPF